VSAREQFAISAYYYNDVTGELEKANQTYELYAKPTHGIGCPTITSVEITRLSDNGKMLLPKFVKRFG
jgi:hypothetical protein